VRTVVLSLAALWFAGGCYAPREPLSQSWQIDRTRILGVISDVLDEDGVSTGRAEASPGDTVRLSSLAVHPEEDLSVLWTGCVADASDEFGCIVDMEALEALFSQDVESMTPAELVAWQTALEAQGFLGVEPYLAPKIHVPEDLLADLPPEKQLEGTSYLLSLVASPDAAGMLEGGTEDLDASDLEESDTEVATKQIVVSQGVEGQPWTPNYNPRILYLLINGEQHDPGTTREVSPGEELTLEPILTTDSVEEYIFVNRDGEAEERMEDPWFSFFTTDGLFDIPYSLSSSPEAAFHVPDEPQEATLRIWVVVRDRRGGMHWQEQVLQMKTQ
jgi:hypothetical protein